MRTQYAGKGTYVDKINILLVKQLRWRRFCKQPTLCLGGLPFQRQLPNGLEQQEGTFVKFWGPISFLQEKFAFLDKTQISCYVWCLLPIVFPFFLIKEDKVNKCLLTQQFSKSASYNAETAVLILSVARLPEHGRQATKDITWPQISPVQKSLK